MEEGRKKVQYYDKKAVGMRIRLSRKNKKMTQSKLSEYLDYTNERQLQRIENGETACSVDKLMEIAQILDVSTDFLLFGFEVKDETDATSIFLGKNKRQKLYLMKLLETATGNMSLLDVID